MPGTKDDGTKKIAPVDEPTKKETPATPDTPPVDDKGKKEGDLILGKYKSTEDLEKAYTELEKKHGTQGQELGTLRSEVAQQRATQAEQAKKDQPPETDYDAKLNEIYEKLEAGDISVVEAVKQSNSLTAEMTMAKAVAESNKRTQDLLIDKDAESAESEWHKDHPDYNEVVASGQLQPYIDKNPILIDETIAYFQFKADQRFEDGKLEAEKIAKGAEIADTVVKEPGGSTRTPTRQDPLSDDKLLESQLGIVKNMRGQA